MSADAARRELMLRRLIGLVIVLLALGVGIWSLFGFWSGRRAQAMSEGYRALRQALAGHSPGFATARAAFLKAAKVAFWDAEPMIMVELTRRLSEITVEPGFSPSSRPSAAAWELTLLRVIRAGRFVDADRLLALAPRAGQRKFYRRLLDRLRGAAPNSTRRP